MTRQVVAIIQSRLGSKRFPRKALASLHGKPIIQHVIERVQQVALVDKIIVAIPTQDFDLIALVRSLKINIVLGPEQDVLMRFWMAALTQRADVIMRITGDCPLWSPKAGEGVLKAYLDDPTNREFWSNDTITTGWPDGTDTEVFSRNLLARARYARTTMTKRDCEHVTTWMRREVGNRAGVYERIQDEASTLKLSVDTPSDLKRVAGLSRRMKLIANNRYGKAEIE